MRPCRWWAESAPLGWNRVKVSENLGATGRPCEYIRVFISLDFYFLCSSNLGDPRLNLLPSSQIFIEIIALIILCPKVGLWPLILLKREAKRLLFFFEKVFQSLPKLLRFDIQITDKFVDKIINIYILVLVIHIPIYLIIKILHTLACMRLLEADCSFLASEHLTLELSSRSLSKRTPKKCDVTATAA